MMELQLGTISDFAYVDERGKFFILGEFRYINSHTIPAIHKRLALTFRVVGDKVEGYDHDLKVDLTDADGNSILPKPIEGPIKFDDFGAGAVGKIKAQAVIEFNGAKFDTWGDYSFQIFIDKRHVGAVHLTIVKLPKPKTKKKKTTKRSKP